MKSDDSDERLPLDDPQRSGMGLDAYLHQVLRAQRQIWYSQRTTSTVVNPFSSKRTTIAQDFNVKKSRLELHPVQTEPLTSGAPVHPSSQFVA